MVTYPLDVRFELIDALSLGEPQLWEGGKLLPQYRLDFLERASGYVSEVNCHTVQIVLDLSPIDRIEPSNQAISSRRKVGQEIHGDLVAHERRVRPPYIEAVGSCVEYVIDADELGHLIERAARYDADNVFARENLQHLARCLG